MAGFATVAFLHFVCVVSPGPDFAVIVKNALIHSRQYATWTALGIACGLIVHLAYCILGLAFIISQSILAFQIIKLLGAAYLIYLGISSLRVKPKQNKEPIPYNSERPKNHWKGFMEGFWCNVLNPKATLFFLSLFTLVVDPNTPLWIQSLYGVEMISVTFLWFAFIARMISLPTFKKRVSNFQTRLNKIMGGVLLFFGVQLALSSR